MDPATLEKLIIREIRKAREISRRDVADRLGIAKSTAGRRVDSMIERGLLCEKGIESRKDVGRPRRFLGLEGSYGSFAGFDFDARTLYGVMIDFAQNTVARERVDLSEKPSRGEILETMSGMLKHFGDSSLLGVGVGVPGHVERESRTALGYAFIEDWENVDLLDELALTRDRLHIENNTRAIALGEYWLGARAASEHMACLNVRTGISAAVISGGQLLTGRHEMAGEIRGWGAQREKTDSSMESRLEEVATVRSLLEHPGFTDFTWSGVVEHYRGMKVTDASDDPIRTISEYHADAISRIVQLVDPGVVFLAGPFTEIGDLYLNMVRRAVAESLEGHYFSPPPIQFVTLGEYAGALGASALAASHYLPDPG